MRSISARRAAAATALLVGLLGLTACNSDDSTATDTTADEPTTSTTDASSASPTEGSETPTAGETVDPSQFVSEVLGSLTDATTAHLKMTTTGGPSDMTMEGDVDYSANPPEMSMTMTDPSQADAEIGFRLVDGVIYMQMAQLGNGKWLKMDMGGKNSPLGGGLMDQMDPGAGLEQMESAIDDVTYVGDEEVDGESMHHYTMKVRSQAFRDLQGDLGTTGGSKLPSVITYDIWTDDAGMMRQTELAMGDLGSVTVAMSNWGEPVDISAPPESDIMTMPDGSMLGGSSSS